MTELKCQNCQESFIARGARFCPYCGSSSVSLVIKEQKRYPPEDKALIIYSGQDPENTVEIDSEDLVEEEERPRRHSKH